MPKYITLLAAFWLGWLNLYGNVPLWWDEYNVVPASVDQADPAVIEANYEMALLGQAKFMAYQAYLAMEDINPGSAGPDIESMVLAFSTAEDDNYVPLLLGQLKSIVKPFYDRFHELGHDVSSDVLMYSNDYPYPWEDPGSSGYDVEVNYEAANIGQLKYLFSFSLEDTQAPLLTLNANGVYAEGVDPQASTPQNIEITGDEVVTINAFSVQISGIIEDPNLQQLLINSTPVSSQLSSGVWSFSYVLSLPTEGLNTVTVEALDSVYNRTIRTFSVVRVTQGPSLSVNTIDDEALVTNSTSQIIAGEIGSSANSLIINGAEVNGITDGIFNTSVDLSEGENIIQISATDGYGNETTYQRTILVDTVPPTITVASPNAGFLTNTRSVTVSGIVNEGDTLTVNYVNVPLNASGSFSTDVSLLEGANTITLRATDSVGNPATVTVGGQVDTIAPEITISQPLANQVVMTSSITISGTVAGSIEELLINNQNATSYSSADGSFSTDVVLVEGANLITIEATDASGNVGSTSITVNLDTSDPVIAILSPVEASPGEGILLSSDTVSIIGSIDDEAAVVTVTNSGGDEITASILNNRFTASSLTLVEGLNTVTVSALDTAGNTTSIDKNITVDTISPSAPILSGAPDTANSDRVMVTGIAETGSMVTVSGGLVVAQDKADTNSDGNGNSEFSVEVLLNPSGANLLRISSKDAAGNVSPELAHEIFYDIEVPVLTVDAPLDNATLTSLKALIIGQASDNYGLDSVTIQTTAGTEIATLEADAFAHELDLSDGAGQVITITATDLAGNQTTITRTVDVADGGVDTEPPLVTVLSPSYDQVVPDSNITVVARVTDESGISEISVNDSVIVSLASGNLSNILSGDTLTFDVTVDAQGEFILKITDDNASGSLFTEFTHRVLVDSSTPVAPGLRLVSQHNVTGTDGGGNDTYAVNTDAITVYGSKISDQDDIGVAFTITGGLVDVNGVIADGASNFSTSVPVNLNQENTLRLVTRGANGNSSVEVPITVVHDSVVPSVVGISPANGAEAVPLSSTVMITFDEAMLNSGVNAIQLLADNTAIAYTYEWSPDAKVLTVTPSADLPESSAVSLVVPDTLTDLATNTLNGSRNIAFTTETVDTAAPEAPVLNSVAALTKESIVVLSGIAEAGSTIDVDVTISGSSSSYNTQVENDGTFQLEVALYPNDTNVITVAATDSAGNVSSQTTTSIVQDSTAITLVGSAPAADATGVDVAANIELTFSEAIDPDTITGVALIGTGIGVIPIAVAQPLETRILITPQIQLGFGQEYEVVVSQDVSDLAGNSLNAIERRKFTTGDSSIPKPIIYSVTPQSRTNVDSVNIHGFATPGTTVVAAGGANSDDSLLVGGSGEFVLNVSLSKAVNSETLNSITLKATDGGVNESAPTEAIEIVHDLILPMLASSTPTHNTELPNGTRISLTFSEKIDPASLAQSEPSIRVRGADLAYVAGNFQVSDSGLSVTFYPAVPLKQKSEYEILVSDGVRDLAGNKLSNPTPIAFTTGASGALDIPDAPVLDPLESIITTEQSITLTGSALASFVLHVVGGQFPVDTMVDANGRFSISVPLIIDQENQLALYVVIQDTQGDDVYGRRATASITQVKHPTGLRIISPQEGYEYNNESITVFGIMDNAAELSNIKVGDEVATLFGDYFVQQVILDSAAGENRTITVTADTADGSLITESVDFTLYIEPDGTDTRAPIPQFVFPEEGEVSNAEVIETMLTVEEGVRLTTVDINNVVAHRVVGNIFFIYAELQNEGANSISVQAIDAEGLIGVDTVTVFLDTTVNSKPILDPATVVDRTAGRVHVISGTADPGSIIVVENGLVPVRVVADAVTGEFEIPVPLLDNTTNRLRIYATDSAGNDSEAITIELVHDDLSPTVVATTPINNQSGVAENATISVTFSEPLDPLTVTENNFTVRDSNGGSISGNLLLSADGKTIQFIPSYQFERQDTITVTLGVGIQDVNSFSLEEAYSFSFGTALYRTTVSGVVVDENLQPLANIKVGIAGTNLTQYTNTFGVFLIDEVPFGDQILYVDGRPDAITGVSPQGDSRVFGYLEFLTRVVEDTDNNLGRPIFMVDTDYSTATPLSAVSNIVTFTPLEKDLADFSIRYAANAPRLFDGTSNGVLTATRIGVEHIPDRLPSGAIPHFMVEVGSADLSFEPYASMTFPNVYDLEDGDEVIVFHFQYGTHNYVELGRATVVKTNDNDPGLITTGDILPGSGFVGIVPADASYDLTRSYLNGRVVASDGQGIGGVSVNAIADNARVVTDAEGNYSIPMPEVRILTIQTYATISTDLGNADGESPSLVFKSGLVDVSPSGITEMPDIVVDSFFLGGNIRYINARGQKLPKGALEYSTGGVLPGGETVDIGELLGVSADTARAVEIYVYRRLESSDGFLEYDSVPYMQTTASQNPTDAINYDSAYSIAFLGSLSDDDSSSGSSSIPQPGDIVKIVALDPETGYYGETDLRIPSLADSGDQMATLDVLANINIDLRPPQVRLDINRVFFIDGIRRRANVPHEGIAFTNDEYIEIKAEWTTAAAIPLNRPELSLAGRLKVESIDYKLDHFFDVTGGENFHILEIREAIFPSRLEVLQQETDVGIETVSISPSGSFDAKSLLPVEVVTTSYGVSQAIDDAANPIITSKQQEIMFHILDLEVNQLDDGSYDIEGRSLPGHGLIYLGGAEFKVDGEGYFSGIFAGAVGEGGIGVQIDPDSIASRFGASLTPEILSLNPDTGSQGDTVIIAGKYFSPVVDDNKVKFNGTPAIVVGATETTLEVLVPNGASAGDVTVALSGKISNGKFFDFISEGINNGSFEDGSFRGYSIDDATIIEQLYSLEATDGRYMAYLNTSSNPIDGITSITTDRFTVAASVPNLLFDYNIMGTAAFLSLDYYLEFYVVEANGTEVLISDVFPDITSLDYSAISGFNQGSGFFTAMVDLSTYAGNGIPIEIKIVLYGRGVLPASIPGMRQDDQNPMDYLKSPGTGLLLDNFRLSGGGNTFDPIDVAALSGGFIADGNDQDEIDTFELIGSENTVPARAQVSVFNILTGEVQRVDANDNGSFSFALPIVFEEVAGTGYYSISYATENSALEPPSNSIFGSGAVAVTIDNNGLVNE